MTDFKGALKPRGGSPVAVPSGAGDAALVEDEDRKRLTVDLTETEWRRFKAAAAMHDATMKDLLRTFAVQLGQSMPEAEAIAKDPLEPLPPKR